MKSLLCRPSSVFVSNGEVFFVDSGNHRVRKVLRNGQIVTICGTGIGGYNGDDQPATNAQLNYPKCVFVSSQNEVYISEREGHRVRKILRNGNIVTVAGTGVKGYNGDNIQATSAQLNSPYGIYVNDGSDELYIADIFNSCIRKVLKNGIITTIAGSFKAPIGVSVLRNEIYVCDQSGHCIKKIDSNGVITTIAGTGDIIGGAILDNNPAIVDGPYSVFVDKQDIYIAEFYRNRIRKIDGNGIITTIAGDVEGDKGYSGDVPFDFQKYPHIGPRKKSLIKPFPKAYHDMIIHVHDTE